MKMENFAAGENSYRLRLALPDLSQAVLGNWFPTFEKLVPTLFDDDLFKPNEGGRTTSFTKGLPTFEESVPKDRLEDNPPFLSSDGIRHGLKSSNERHIVAQPKPQTLAQVNKIREPSKGQKDRVGTRRNYKESNSEENEAKWTLGQIGRESQADKVVSNDELWLRCGEMPPGGPVLHNWEHCHGLENWLLKHSERASPGTNTSTAICTSGPLSSKYLIDDCQIETVERSFQSVPNVPAKIIRENDLVRDAIYALQGLPAAVRKVERLSKIYSTTSVDKSPQSLSKLWTRSVSASALGKVLWVVARAGHIRLQLDTFVRFFLDEQPDPHEKDRSRKAAKKKVQESVASTVKEQQEKTLHSPKIEGNSTSPAVSKVSRYCLINQAFAVAVRGVLRGHSAALNTLASSVCLRRGEEISRGERREHRPGPVIGYGSRDISLLEFFLHTRELRVQLQALAFICLKREENSFVRTPSNEFWVESSMDLTVHDREHNPLKWRRTDVKDIKGDDRGDPLVHSFDSFPRGADLLTYLYDQLVEVDPIHMELLRFLFARAYEPYSVFIQSWLYKAAVIDPYDEFITEHSNFGGVSQISAVSDRQSADLTTTDFKLHRGLLVPRFLENIRAPLIRAGEQLQVLLKLSETCELAQQMANNTRNPELFWPQDVTHAHEESSSTYLPALVFSKRKLDETVKQREMKSDQLSEQFDVLFTNLAVRRAKKEKSRSTLHSSTPANHPVSDGMREMDDEVVPVVGITLQQHISTADLLASQDFSKDKISVVLPKMGWVTSPEDVESEVEVQLKSKSRRSWKIGRDGLAALALKELEPENRVISTVNEDVNNGQLDSQDSVRNLFLTDSMRTSVRDEKVNASPVQSFLSDYQLGTLWPLSGLPMNPFLVQTDVEDVSSNSYVYPSFIGTSQHWDATAKSTRVSKTWNRTPTLEKYREPPNLRETNPELPWFTDFLLAFPGQLFAGLDAQLKLESWGHLEPVHYKHQTEALESFKHIDQLVESYQGLIEPTTLSAREDSASNVPPTPKQLTEAVSFTTVQLESNEPVQVEFPSDLQPDLEAAGDKTSPQGTNNQALSLEGSLPEFEIENGGSRELPTDGDLRSVKSSDEKILEDLLAPNTESEDSTGILPELARFRAGEDNLKDVRMGQGTLACDISDLDQQKVDCSSEQGKPKPLDVAEVQGPARWEQYLQFSDWSLSATLLEKSHDAKDEAEDPAEEDIPLSVVVSKCIADEVLSQYQSVSTLTVRLFQEGLSLQDHYTALRRYFFMERGDWAEYFTTALCQRSGLLGGRLSEMEVQGMLEAAFQRSSCEGDEYTERVFISFQESKPYCENLIHGSTKTSIPSFVGCSRLDAFDFITLQYQVDWPLNLILTSHCLQSYNVVFTFLMRIKLTVHALGDIWKRLQVIDRALLKERASSVFQEQRSRFRTLQQFRQQIFHFVTTVQRYVESRLLNVVWSKFNQNIQMEVNDMQDLETVHRTYLEDAMTECFLSEKSNGVKGCIDSIMQCVLDLSSHMKNAFNPHVEKVDLIDNGLFTQVNQLKNVFQTSLQRLHGYHTKQESPNKTNLVDLWMVLDFNGFLTSVSCNT